MKYTKKAFIYAFIGFIYISSMHAMMHMPDFSEKTCDEQITAEIELVGGIFDLDLTSKRLDIPFADFSFLKNIPFKKCFWNVANKAEEFTQMGVNALKEVAVFSLSPEVIQPIKRATLNTAFTTALSTAVNRELPKGKEVGTLFLKNISTEAIPKNFPAGKIAARYLVLIPFQKDFTSIKADMYNQFLNDITEEGLQILSKALIQYTPEICIVSLGKNLSKLLYLPPDKVAKVLIKAAQKSLLNKEKPLLDIAAQTQLKSVLSQLLKTKKGTFKSPQIAQAALAFTISFYCDEKSMLCKKIAENLTEYCVSEKSKD